MSHRQTTYAERDAGLKLSHLFWNLRGHPLNEFDQNPRCEYEGKPNSRYQQVLTLAGLHVVSCDFQVEVNIYRWLRNLVTRVKLSTFQ